MSDFTHTTPQPRIPPRRFPAVVHHAEVAGILQSVRASDAVRSVRLAAEFQILTAARSVEVLDAHWGDIDLGQALWRVSRRMNKRTAEGDPLSSQALDVLDKARDPSGGEGLVFLGRSNRALSPSSLSALLCRLGINAVPHAFRASFRDWCAETGVRWNLSELSFGHVVPDHLAASFFRTDLLDLQRETMQAWGDYVCASPAAR